MATPVTCDHEPLTEAGNDKCESPAEFIIQFAKGGTDCVYACKQHVGDLLDFSYESQNIVREL